MAGPWNTPSTEDTKTDGPAVLERYGTAAMKTCDMRLRNQIEAWATPRANDPEKRGNFDPTDPMTGIAGQAAMWTTPQSHDTAPGDPSRVGRYGTEHGGRNLTDDVMLWRTPDAPGSGDPRNRQNSIGNGHQVTIAEQAESFWYTPNTPNGGRPVSADVVESKGQTEDGKRQVGLESQSRHWPTPAARDYRSEAGSEATVTHFNRAAGPSLPAMIEHGFSLPDPQTETDGQSSCGRTRTSRLRLNPAFVCLLMGWPWWLTRPEPISFARREMESWLSAQRWHLRSLLTARGLTCRNSEDC